MESEIENGMIFILCVTKEKMMGLRAHFLGMIGFTL